MHTRADALAAAAHEFDCGGFQRTLARRVAYRTESQNADRAADLLAYLRDEIAPSLAAIGVRCSMHDNPEPGKQPLLIGERIEDASLPTVLVYGHGDVVRGLEGRWRDRARRSCRRGGPGRRRRRVRRTAKPRSRWRSAP